MIYTTNCIKCNKKIESEKCYTKYCNVCKSKRQRENYKKFKAKNPGYYKNYYYKNREKLLKRGREWKKLNRGKILEEKRNRKERKINLYNTERIPIIKKYLEDRERFEIKQRFKFKVNKNIAEAFKRRDFGRPKKGSYKKIIGLGYDVLALYFEKQYIDNYGESINWEEFNTKEFHVDHKIPIDLAETKEDCALLCSWRNLEVITEVDNQRKHNTYSKIDRYNIELLKHLSFSIDKKKIELSLNSNNNIKVPSAS